MDLGLSWIEWLWFPQGAHVTLLTVVLFCASLVPSDSVRHLGLHGPSDSGPHPGMIGTWILYSNLGLTLTRDLWSHSGPQTKLVILVPPLASPLPGDSSHPLASLGLLNLVFSLSLIHISEPTRLEC